MNNLGECLRLLGFLPNVAPSVDEIKKRWKQECMKHHPDRGGDIETFKRVTHAYKMLTDSEYRHRHQRDAARRGERGDSDLNLRLVIPIAFDDAFFGRKMVFSYNNQELDEEFSPIVKSKLSVSVLNIQIPVGAMSGFSQTFAGMGHVRKGICGDAIVEVAVLPHPKFTVTGNDVMAKEHIPLDTMLRGGNVNVQTMYGIKILVVPPGTMPGQRLPVSKNGIGLRGDHLVEVVPVFPTPSDLKESKWSGLGISWDGAPAPKDNEEEDLLKAFEKLKGA